MVYSLANYQLSIQLPQELASEFGTSHFALGGEGSYTDSISINISNQLFQVAGDNTGSYVFNKNLNRTGNIQITLNQLSDKVGLLKNIYNLYLKTSTEIDGLTITVNDNDNNLIATCIDCFPNNIPQQQFGNGAATQTWQFECGQITFN